MSKQRYFSIPVILGLITLAGFAYGTLRSEADTPSKGDEVALFGMETVAISPEGRSLGDVAAELSTRVGFQIPEPALVPSQMELVGAEAFLGPVQAVHRYGRAALWFEATLERGDARPAFMQVIFTGGDFVAPTKGVAEFETGTAGVRAYVESHSGPDGLVGEAYYVVHDSGGMVVSTAGDSRATGEQIRAFIGATLTP